ncbi:unnamed protein product [Eruca vesicaria subsp. sativa]|uniref:F-box domain-containing protein n=1 Tax=Eruca vesicaria subsp. sativa TaxID=29727 RepID=A0ABC8J651_ERUVS|nr:unnamed protein product [Eruca vesicaria subsp. sativa]
MVLPWDLEEEILSRVPPLSLARFRSVCKRWNGLFNESKFIKCHLARARPQIIFLSKSNMYSIEINDLAGVDPAVKLRDLASLPSSCEIAHQEIDFDPTRTIKSFDGLLFCNFWPPESRAALWSPWLSSGPPPQVKWIEFGDAKFHVSGIGYDKNKVYKMFGSFICLRQVHNNYHQRAAVYHCSSQVFKFVDTPGEDWPIREAHRYSVSLNGNLYWITSNVGKHFIRSFDFSKEILKPFCLLPCHKNDSRDELVLEVFKGEGFSLLKQCYVTRKIEIWVTNKKIGEEEGVVWIIYMTLPTTNLPSLFNSRLSGTISYFFYGKTIVICCGDNETGAACIYIVRSDLFKKFPIGSAIYHSCHCVYAPSLTPLHMISD